MWGENGMSLECRMEPRSGGLSMEIMRFPDAGSHFLPHVDTEKTNGMFATIVIVLPSEFTGGAAHLSHGSLSEVYDSSTQSLSQTTVMAWYTDVKHEVKPITSGYRLVLSYNLLHTTSALRPALQDNSVFVEQLQHILLSWKQRSDEDVPSKIAYLLEYKYSSANLNGSALKGSDAQIVAVLDKITRQHGFHLGLATVVCRVSGTAERAGCFYGRNRGRRGRYGFGYDPYSDFDEYGDDDDDGEDAEMGDIDDVSVNLERLVDLDGRLIKQDMDLDSETEAIPADLQDVLQDGDHDGQEYEGYMGNYGGSLERWYNRTMLVIWPDTSNFDIMHGAQGFQYACDKICTTTSLAPTAEESELADYILRSASAAHGSQVIKSVCFAATIWRDFSLWVRAVKACDGERSLTILGDDNISKALAAFGFDDVQPILETTLARDPSNTARFRWLETFEIWVANQDSVELTSGTKEWLSQQRSKVIATLKKPEKDEYKFLVDVALAQGGITFLENTIFPQVKAVSGPWFLREFADYLHKERERFQAPVICARLVRDLLVTAADRVNFYGPVPQNTPAAAAYPYGRPLPTPESPVHLMRAKLFIETCISTSNEDLLTGAVDKLTNMSGVTIDVARTRGREVLLPLITSLNDSVRARPAHHPFPNFAKLCDTAVSLYVDSIIGNPAAIKQADLTTLLQTLLLFGQSQLLLSSIAPKLETLQLDTSQLRMICEELYNKRQQLSPPDGLAVHAIVVRLAKKYAQAVHLRQTAHYSYSYPTYGAGATPADVTDIVNALDFCLRVNAIDGCSIVLDRALDAQLLKETYIDRTLGPLVPELVKLAQKHKQSITSTAFATAFRKVMVAWIDKIMGPQPADASIYFTRLQNWTCTCTSCVGVRTFLVSKVERSQTWSRIGAPTRKHVEGFLVKHAFGMASWETVRTSPQGVTVKKADSIFKPVNWLIYQRNGSKLLLGISKDTTELKAILGADYNRILAALKTRTTATSSVAGGSRTSTAGTAQSKAAAARPAAVAGQVSARNVAPGALGAIRPVPATFAGGPPAKRRKATYDPNNVIDIS